MSVRADYPSKRVLTEIESLRVLRDGPRLEWFEPWAEHGVVLANLSQRFGFIHVLPDEEADQMRRYDIHLFDSQEALAWALDRLHTVHPACGDDCLGLFYFTPDEPVRFRLVVEPDDDEDEEAES